MFQITSDFFKDWHFDKYTAVSPDRKTELWICGGFSSFKTYKVDDILFGLSFFERLKVWRALKQASKYQTMKKIDDKNI